MQLDPSVQDEFSSMLGIEDEQPEVIFDNFSTEFAEQQEVPEPQQEVEREEPAPEPAPVSDPIADRFAEYERKMNDRLESFLNRLQPQATQQPAQYQQPAQQYAQPPRPMEPTRVLTDVDLLQYNQYNQQVLQQHAQALHNVMVNTEAQKLNAAKAELRSSLPDVFNVVPEDKIEAAFKHAMQHGKFDVPWVDQISTAYWRVKGPELSKAQIANNELAAKRAVKAKEAQRSIPAGGASYQAPAASQPTGGDRGFEAATARFRSMMQG